jgi:HAD superfamily hydrolase (TIGR01509 family)
VPELEVSRAVLRAVLFDLDGVVADSHPVHEVAWKELFAEQGLDADNLNLDYLYAGHPRREIMTHYLGALDAERFEHLSKRKDYFYAQAVALLAAKPGIPVAIMQLRAAGIACALATSAARDRTFETLERLHLQDAFAAVVVGSDVEIAKPAPDIFLLAASKLNVAPESCAVVEDSVAGVQAAVRAGMSCAGFALPNRADELWQAGAKDVFTAVPADAVSYFRKLQRNTIAGEAAAERQPALTNHRK